MLTTEAQRLQLLAGVFRKEHFASLFEQGKIGYEEYLVSINAIRASENLPPLTLADTACLPRRRAGSRRQKIPLTPA